MFAYNATVSTSFKPLMFQHLQYIACKNESLEVLHTKTTKITNHLLSSLKPYSSYKITVFAENGENSGKPLSVIIYTLQKGKNFLPGL